MLSKTTAWSPFAHRVFSLLRGATLISGMGTWINEVGSGWLMTTLRHDPLIVALLQTATAAPILTFHRPTASPQVRYFLTPRQRCRE